MSFSVVKPTALRFAGVSADIPILETISASVGRITPLAPGMFECDTLTMSRVTTKHYIGTRWHLPQGGMLNQFTLDHSRTTTQTFAVEREDILDVETVLVPGETILVPTILSSCVLKPAAEVEVEAENLASFEESLESDADSMDPQFGSPVRYTESVADAVFLVEPIESMEID